MLNGGKIKRYLPFRDGQAARKGNLYCHPSRRDCAKTSMAQTRFATRSIGPHAARLLTQTRPFALKRKAVTVSSQLFRSLRLLHNCQLTVLVGPPPPPGAIIAREPQCQRERWCPESAYINIIPSGLCNSSLERHLPLQGHQYSKKRCPARSSCQLRVSTIRIMLSTLRQ